MSIKKLTIRAIWLLSVAAASTLSVAQAENQDALLPIFDAHIHYSYDAWEAFSPDDAIR